MAEHVLITGASGLVGQAAARAFAAAGFQVTAVSRRPPTDAPGVRFVSLDLNDAEACRRALAGAGDITRLVFAALHEEPGLVAGWLEDAQIETNARMLRNVLDPLLETARGLKHVTLLQGTKAYGAHVRRIPIPAREDRDELRSVPNFYWRQEDLLRERAHGAAWSWTIFRPQIIFGDALGAAMNLIPAIGAYGAILRAEGRPLAFPGGPTSILEAVDADLLARAIVWAGAAEGAANRALNITNGDVFTWHDVWPAIAEALGMAPGPHEPLALAEAMPPRAAEWDAIRARHDLAAPDLAAFVGAGFQYADFTMGYGYPGDQQAPVALVSTVRLRQAGFGEALDTEAMFRKWFGVLQGRGLLPPP